ncbi:hypothetical protein QQP08_008723 [Theobroma cacao]|nr:hypothetical protein QQP08_008723 [Theobroma cacao]
MGAQDYWDTVPPTVAPLNLEREEHWRRFDNSVNAVSFGFVATAILISMFLMTIYANGVSVLMPGEETPTFIAHPAPAPCPPERILKPLLHQNQSIGVSSTSRAS